MPCAQGHVCLESMYIVLNQADILLLLLLSHVTAALFCLFDLFSLPLPSIDFGLYLAGIDGSNLLRLWTWLVCWCVAI